MMKRLLLGLFVLCLLNLSADAASRFWVGGTGTWDASDTTHWAASNGGAGGQSVPGSSDTVTFTSLSGGGTVTLNFGGTVTIQSISMGGFTGGTLDNSVNNNNVTVTGASSGIDYSGTVTRVLKLGTATYTLTNNSSIWDGNDGTSLTFTGSGATIVFTGASLGRVFRGGDKTFGTLTIGASSGSGTFSISSNNTFGTLNIAAPNWIEFRSGDTQTVTNALALVGTSSSPITLLTNTNNATSIIAAAGGSTLKWAALRNIVFTGAPVATNSFDLKGNSGVTINPPIPTGSNTCILGG